jgi:hypothetical protein
MAFLYIFYTLLGRTVLYTIIGYRQNCNLRDMIGYLLTSFYIIYPHIFIPISDVEKKKSWH